MIIKHLVTVFWNVSLLLLLSLLFSYYYYDWSAPLKSVHILVWSSFTQYLEFYLSFSSLFPHCSSEPWLHAPSTCALFSNVMTPRVHNGKKFAFTTKHYTLGAAFVYNYLKVRIVLCFNVVPECKRSLQVLLMTRQVGSWGQETLLLLTGWD